MLKIIVSDEKGRVVAWALVIMALGALLLPPLLSHVSANLIASQAIEQGLKEQYSADSGVEYAMLQIQMGITTSQAPYTYTINNKYVDVTWGEYISQTFKITSTATSQIDGNSTTIESYISLSTLDFLWLLDNAITSAVYVEISPNTAVSGTVEYGGELNNKGTITGTVEGSVGGPWPGVEDTSSFYFAQIEDLGLDSTPFPDDVIDVGSGTEADPYPVGPLYYIGDDLHPLQIKSTVNNAVAMLNGIMYVESDLEVGERDQDFTLDLNGQTIYVEGDIRFGTKCTIAGSGCIFAEGDVVFLPKAQLSVDEFVFVMSIEGTTQLQPQGDYYGSVAGNVEVDLQPGSLLLWKEPPAGLNFPDGTSGIVQIRTYNVYP
jgi:hypothetical protein